MDDGSDVEEASNGLQDLLTCPSMTFGCGETFATDYSSPRPRNLTELRSRLEHLLESISVQTIARAYESFIRRCNMCVEVEGGHFEQLL